MKVSDLCDKLETALVTRPPGAERFEIATQALRQVFRLQADEVAILVADVENDVLRFVWPVKLQKSGNVPISARDSLAARTYRENKTVANNRFAATYHASVFEHVKLDPSIEKPQPIQKILSAPLPGADGIPKGVVQISRKGIDSNQTGPDFSANDVAIMDELAKSLGKYL